MKNTLLGASALTLLLVSTAFSVQAQQLAPTPRSAPRVPVNSIELEGSHEGSLASRRIQGIATVTEGDKLTLSGVNLRLFGIVAPQMNANMGPQSRAALDSILAGQNLTCGLHNRDRDGRVMAVCRTAANIDPALEMLKRGLAVSARGSLGHTELAAPYQAAEQAAQAQKVGLWAAAPAATAPAAAVVAAANAAPAPELVKTEAVKIEPAAPIPVPVTVSADRKTVSVTPTAAAPIAAAPIAVPAINVNDLSAGIDDGDLVPAKPGFFERYQLLISGLLMLLTALSILTVMTIRRMIDKRDEMRAIAAALRGELQAARAVCITRIKMIVSENDDRSISWPRLRSTLYQAYVGRLGWLGASLSRQIASIYGQASDYAAYYNYPDDERVISTPKRQALQNLVGHIEEVLPRLIAIETDGKRPVESDYPTPPDNRTETRYAAVSYAQPASITRTRTDAERGIAGYADRPRLTASDIPSITPDAKSAASELTGHSSISGIVKAVSTTPVSPLITPAPATPAPITKDSSASLLSDNKPFTASSAVATTLGQSRPRAKEDQPRITPKTISARSEGIEVSRVADTPFVRTTSSATLTPGATPSANTTAKAEPFAAATIKPAAIKSEATKPVPRTEGTRTETERSESIKSVTASTPTTATKTDAPKVESTNKLEAIKTALLSTDDGMPAKLAPLWESVRNYARDKFGDHSVTGITDEDVMAEYTAMIERDMENMAYDDDDSDHDASTAKKRLWSAGG